MSYRDDKNLSFKEGHAHQPKNWRDQWKSYALLILLIIFVRSLIVEPFRIPSGSMIPTLLIGDHIFVAKSAYDIGIPFTQIKWLRVSDPKRGDVVVFDYPNYEKNEAREGLYYIKRVIGIPGDKISIKGGVPYFDSQPVSQQFVGLKGHENDLPGFVLLPSGAIFKENLLGSRHEFHWGQRYPRHLVELERGKAYLKEETGQDCLPIGEAILHRFPTSYTGLNEICSFVVPEDQYFVMGDNRDDSEDGRSWGLLERKNLRGRAFAVWLSLLLSDGAGEKGPKLRLSRFGYQIK